MQSPIQTFLAELHGELAGVHRGGLATYIPELTKADPEWFGICLVTMDGVAYSVGDTGQTTEAQWRRIELSMATFVGRDLRVDESVYRSESETGFRNRAIAWMLKN